MSRTLRNFVEFTNILPMSVDVSRFVNISVWTESHPFDRFQPVSALLHEGYSFGLKQPVIKRAEEE